MELMRRLNEVPTKSPSLHTWNTVRVPCETVFFSMKSHSSSKAQNLGSKEL